MNYMMIPQNIWLIITGYNYGMLMGFYVNGYNYRVLMERSWNY